MSIQAIAWVLEHSLSEGFDRLVLLAIANHADASGLNAWPSAERVAQEARVHRATVFRAISRLVELGELQVLDHGRGRGRRNSYQVCLQSQAATLNQSFTVAASAIKGRTRATHNRPEPVLQASRPSTSSAGRYKPPPVEDPRELDAEDVQVGRVRLNDVRAAMDKKAG